MNEQVSYLEHSFYKVLGKITEDLMISSFEVFMVGFLDLDFFVVENLIGKL